MKRLLFAALLLLATALLLAACFNDAPAASIEAVPEFTGDNIWQVTDSTVAFTATREGADFTGTFRDVDLAIDFDPDAPETGRIRAVVYTASAFTDDPERDDALPGRDWFSTKAFPTAVWVSDDISATPGGYLARGTLTLKGVSQPADLPFTLDVMGDTARADGTLTLQRNAFDVGSGAFATDEWIAYPVRVDVQIAASR